jgi:hypothetical protein
MARSGVSRWVEEITVRSVIDCSRVKNKVRGGYLGNNTALDLVEGGKEQMGDVRTPLANHFASHHPATLIIHLTFPQFAWPFGFTPSLPTGTYLT